MGMFDEIRCEAPLPDGPGTTGAWFQTKSFPHPSLSRFVITAAGRLVDLAGNDCELDGYIVMYTIDPEPPHDEAGPSAKAWREYRLRFTAGQLQTIERVTASMPKDRNVGLASCRCFDVSQPPDSGQPSS